MDERGEWLGGGKAYAKEHEKEIANHFAAMEIDGGAGHPWESIIPRKQRSLCWSRSPEFCRFRRGHFEFSEHAGGADIGPLTKQGVPGFSPIQDNRTYFHYHHTAADTLDKIVPHELAENAAVVAVTAYALANLEQPLPR